MTFGQKLNYLRKNAGLTQEDVAQHLGISPQAVSKWENDLSCPDIMLLPEIAKLYEKTVDALLSDGDFAEAEAVEEKETTEEKEEIPAEEKQPEPVETETESKKNLDNSNLFLKVKVLSQQGDKVNIKLPVSLLKSLKSILGSVKLNSEMTGGIDLSGIDFDSIFELIESGAIGDIVDITSQNGDIVKICVERDSI